MTDTLLFVIAQDFHSLCKYSINSLLSLFQLRTIDNVEELEPQRFLEELLGSRNLSIYQENHIAAFRSRVLEHGVPKNVEPNSFRYPCDACKDIAPTKPRLEEHKKTHDADRKRLACGYQDYDFTTYYSYALKVHKETHKPGFKPYACPHGNSDNKDTFRAHLKTHDPNRKVQKCTLMQHFNGIKSV